MLTLEILTQITPGAPFAMGVEYDQEDGLFMDGTKRLLLWVAVKGYENDWCIYTHFADRGQEFVMREGDKVCSPNHITKLVPCEDEVFSRYRY
ncbi:MAG: hypothetical protein WC750_06135 [Patescibacteria group bacterium]|jgi:hypothetical protein